MARTKPGYRLAYRPTIVPTGPVRRRAIFSDLTATKVANNTQAWLMRYALAPSPDP